MKFNYYEILGLNENASLAEITRAYTEVYNEYQANKDIMSEADIAQVKEFSKAYKTLSNPELKAQYDAALAQEVAEIQKQIENKYEAVATEVKQENVMSGDLRVNEPWFKRHSVELISGGLILSLAVGAFLGAHAVKKDIDDTYEANKKQEEMENTPVLTAKNIDKMVDNIVKENEKKGLTIDSSKVKSALFITNINTLSADDIYAIFAHQLDGVSDSETRTLMIAEEIQNMYDYCSAVRTHNNNGGEYISMVNLACDREDRLVLTALDTEYCNLAKALKDGKITEKEYQESFKRVTDFYTGAGYITTSGETLTNYSMTAGGGLLTEMYFPMYAVAYRSSTLETKENEIDIKTLSENVVNGSKYLGSIIAAADCQVNENNQGFTK